MAHVTADSLRGTLGTTIEYVFTGPADVKVYRTARRERLRWRDEKTFVFLSLIAFLGLILIGLSLGWNSGALVGFSIGSVLTYFLPETLKLCSSLIRLKLTLHPGWIGFAEKRNLKVPFSLPFTDMIRTNRVKTIEWLDGNCLIRRKWSSFRPIFIDGRLLAQDGAIDAICEWALQHGIAVNGIVPILSQE